MVTNTASGRHARAVSMADWTPAPHSSPTAARSPTRSRPPAQRSGSGVSSEIGAGDGVGVAVGIDSAMSGVGAEMPEQPVSRMAAVNAKATARAGEPARSGGAWINVTGAVPREDGGVHAQSVSVSWVRGMPRIYHTGNGVMTRCPPADASGGKVAVDSLPVTPPLCDPDT